MHAVVARVTLENRAVALDELDGLVSHLSEIPGFVGGSWVALQGDSAISVIVCDTEAAAQTIADLHTGEQSRGLGVKLEGVEVGQVVKHV